MNMFFVILASILFGSFPSLQKNVLNSGVSPLALVIVCNAVAGLFALIICLIRKVPIKINKKQLLSLIPIGVIGLFATDYLLDIAYTMIPVGYVTMIHFLYPALVCAAMCIFFREKLTKFKFLAVIFSICGLILLTGGGFSSSLKGILVALATAIFYCFYMIATDKTPAREVDPLLRVFYTNTCVVITACILVAASYLKNASTGNTQTFVFPDTPGLWIQCLIVGVMLGMATFLINIGIQKIGAGTASFINMVEPVTSLVVSFLVYHYAISGLNIVGCILILGSLLFAAKSE